MTLAEQMAEHSWSRSQTRPWWFEDRSLSSNIPSKRVVGPDTQRRGIPLDVLNPMLIGPIF